MIVTDRLRRWHAVPTTIAMLLLLVPSGRSNSLLTPDQAAVIESEALRVRVDRYFPRVIDYTDRTTGAVLYGSDRSPGTIVINGQPYQPLIKSDVAVSGPTHTISYRMTFPDAYNVVINVSISVADRFVTLEMNIEDGQYFQVHTVEIPGHDLLSVRSSQPGAVVATAQIDLSIHRCGDRILLVNDDTPLETEPVSAAYAIVSTNDLAAAIETNSVYENPSRSAASGNCRLWMQTIKTPEYTRVGLWSGQWTHRARGAVDTEPAPWVRIAISGDRNNDGVVDWQDGAIALRDIAVNPLGAEMTPLRVVQHIPFNFASQASHGFLKTLDNVKRISLSTDHLGQLAILKGYQSEGHDSGHPDYAGNYNQRAGGLTDLQILLREGEKWNTLFGVHVNATESYPVARTFSNELVDTTALGWDWLDQSYMIDQRRDLLSGDIFQRFSQLREETHQNLNFLYIDVYRSGGWVADRLLRELREQGWHIGTEWSHRMERDALWTHWSCEPSYGGDDYRGINSVIIRFIRNHQKDVFIDDSLLMSANIVEWEGWGGKADYTAFYANIFDRNLPTKYMQHFPVMKWSDQYRFLADNVIVTDSAGRRQILKNNRLVYDSPTYLQPWDPRSESRLYHWNPQGGTTTWTLPESWSGAETVQLYRLTDQGRLFEASLPVVDERISLESVPGTAYVIYKTTAPDLPDPKWGEGGMVRDPGFNSDHLEAWQLSGNSTSAQIVVNELGHYELVIEAGGAVSVSQQLTGLTPGTYAASVWIEIPEGTRRTTLAIAPDKGNKVSRWIERSTAKNLVAEQDKRKTLFQRLRVLFDLPEKASEATLSLNVDAGQQTIRFDDVRVVRTLRSSKDGTVVFEDFENVDQGWYPFVKGDAGGTVGPRTHIAQKHAPYTQAGWNGKLVDDVINGENSLKAHEERQGVVYRTTPYSVRFETGKHYRVSFTYECAFDDEYAWLTGHDSEEQATIETETKIEAAQEPTLFSYEFVAEKSGDYWVGLKKLTSEDSRDQADFILDDFSVEVLSE